MTLAATPRQYDLAPGIYKVARRTFVEQPGVIAFFLEGDPTPHQIPKLLIHFPPAPENILTLMNEVITIPEDPEAKCVISY